MARKPKEPTGEVFENGLDDQGREVLDDTPVAIPVRMKRAETLLEQVQSVVRGELSRQAMAEGLETFDEANDFDVGDDYDPRSEYEVDEYADEVFERDQAAQATREFAQQLRRARGHRDTPAAAGSGEEGLQPGRQGHAPDSGGDPPAPASGSGKKPGATPPV